MDHYGNVRCHHCDRKFYPLKYRGRVRCPHCQRQHLGSWHAIMNAIIITVSLVAITGVACMAYNL